MKTRDTRTDSGQYYPGGNVIPRQPVRPGGGSDADAVHYYAETRTDNQKAQARANMGAMSADTKIPDVLGKLPIRPLPKYLHELAFDDTYPEDAAWLYSQLGPSDLGRCSAVRRGGKLWRNYDWTFDDAAEFVVRMSGNATRFASVGVASVGSRLTENDVMSAVNSRYYKCLPGMTLDGINDKGVVCEINVDGGPKTGWHGDAEDDGIHILAAVRWVLDHGETAQQAAEWLADHIIQPTGEMNFHFMVADATKTYIVENGVAHDVTNGTKVLTNYGVFDAAQAGGGKERYQLLAGGADISAVNWTKAYQPGNTWHSDFESEAQHAAAIEQWAAQGTDKEAHRGKTTTSGKPWWQTVHTSEYDFAAKTMRVAVQESGEYFTFAVGAKSEVAWGDVTGKPTSFPPSAHTHNKIVSGESEIRADLTAKVQSGWTDQWEPNQSVPNPLNVGDKRYYGIAFVEDGSMPGWYCMADEWDGENWIPLSDEHLSSNRDATELTFPDNTPTHRIPAFPEKTIATTDQLPTASQLLTPEQAAEIAKVEDKRDLTDYAVKLTTGNFGIAKWFYTNGTNFIWNADTDRWEDEEVSSHYIVGEYVNGVWHFVSNFPSAKEWDGFESDEDEELGHKYVAVFADSIAKKSETLAPGLSAQGVPTDPNVRDLFSESNTSLVQAVDAKAATSAANIPDHGVAVVDGSSGTAASKQTVTVSFAAAKGTELRMCELLITDVAEDDAVTVSLPAGTYQFADGADATKKADGNHFIFTEYARGCWFVNRVSTEETEVA